MKIIFDKSLSSEILKALGKSVNKESKIIDKKTQKPVLSRDGEEIELNDFAGVVPGSEIYLKSDIVSLIKYVENNAN